MTTGEGGIVVSDDPAFTRRIRMFVNKAWPYGEENPDHEFLALNSRMTELQGAVANAQLDKLEAGVAQRIEMADQLTDGARRRSGHHHAGRARRRRRDLVEVRAPRRRRRDPRRPPGARGRAPARRHRVRAALHPEAGVRVPGLHRAAHVRDQPLALHPGPARGASTTRPNGFPARSSSSITSWYFPGTSATRRTTSSSSATRSAPPSRT